MKVDKNISVKNASWTFSGDVPKEFEDHVCKSVPLYKEGHQLILELTDFFLHDHSLCYEIGCSTGLLSSQIAQRNSDKKVKVIGMDIEPDMVEYAKGKYGKTPRAQFIHQDIVSAELESCDLIISYYTIQFIPPKVRQLVFDKIYKSLNWGGAFLLFEKVRAKDARFQDIATSLYTEYKIGQGYSSDEIISKSKSLKGVLEPFSTQGNVDLMKRAGFVDVMSIMKYVCFEGFLAIK
ncbi:MAG: methyltransferase domain-containing protein [Bacteroidota bacterium]